MKNSYIQVVIETCGDPFLLYFYESAPSSPDVHKRTYIGQPSKLYRSPRRPIQVHPPTNSGLKHPLIGDCRHESCTLFGMLRHRTPSSPIYLSEVIHKPFALSRVFLLFSGRKSIFLVKEKAPSRSGILLSMHVVLKTRYVNPNIHARRYQSHVRSSNLSATRPQLLSLRGATSSYRSRHKAIQEAVQSYIALPHTSIYLYIGSTDKGDAGTIIPT